MVFLGAGDDPRIPKLNFELGNGNGLGLDSGYRSLYTLYTFYTLYSCSTGRAADPTPNNCSTVPNDESVSKDYIEYAINKNEDDPELRHGRVR